MAHHLIIHAAGPDAGKVEFDVHPSHLPPLLADDDGRPIMPSQYCGLRVVKALEFFWLDAEGRRIGTENHGDVSELGEEAHLGGVEFRGPLGTCPGRLTNPADNQWRFVTPLTASGGKPPPPASRLVIELKPASRIAFLDKNFKHVDLGELYEGTEFDDLEKTLGAFCEQFPESCEQESPTVCDLAPALCGKPVILDLVDDWLPTAGKIPWRIGELSNLGKQPRLDEPAYQREVERQLKRDQMPVWLDFDDSSGRVFVNALFGPARGRWIARHGLTAAQYADFFHEHIRAGHFTLRQLESYVRDGQVRYAVLAVERRDAHGLRAYHGLTIDQHQERFDDWVAHGFFPVNVSVTSAAGKRRVAAFYEKRDVGGFAARSVMTGEQYQRFADQQVAAGHGLAYLKVHRHDGELTYSAIFHRRQNPKRQAFRHGLTQAQYLSELERQLKRGFSPRMVSTASAGGELRIAALWQRTLARPKAASEPVIQQKPRRQAA
jgi:hypothetical protein